MFYSDLKEAIEERTGARFNTQRELKTFIMLVMDALDDVAEHHPELVNETNERVISKRFY